MKASIVIPTYCRRKRLSWTLLALNQQTEVESFDVIVVDDGSHFDTKKILEDLNLSFEWAWYWNVDAGFRAAKSRNTGAIFANNEIVIFIDDDIFVEKDFVSNHIQFHSQYQNSVGLGLRHRIPFETWDNWINYDSVDLSNCLIDPRKNVLDTLDLIKYPWCYMCTNYSLPRKNLLEAGMFDETFEGYGFEDTELAYRLFRMGMNFGHITSSPVFHLEDRNADFSHNNTLDAIGKIRLKEFLRNGRKFATKYPGDRVVQLLTRPNILIEFLGSRTGSPSDAYSDSLSPPKPIPPEFSLFTPFRDEEDELETLTVTYLDTEELADLGDEAAYSALDVLESTRNLCKFEVENSNIQQFETHKQSTERRRNLFSILTPYEDGDEQVDVDARIKTKPLVEGTNESAWEVLQRVRLEYEEESTSLVQKLIHIGSTIVILPLVLAAWGILLSMFIVTGRYRRIFRRDSK